MAANTISNQVDDAQRAMQQAFGGLNAGATSLLQAFAKSHQDRAARLAAAEEALVKEVGATDPQVIELRTRKERSLQFAAGIQTALQRAQAVPQPATGQQAFAGQVQTADGARAQGVTVRLASTINKVTKKIGEARTNQFGDFALNIPLCELTVPADATPDWQLVVEDAAGQTLASQEVSFDPAAGLVPFVPLTLNPPAAAPSAPAAAQAQPVVADKPKPADKPPAKPAKVSSKDPEAC